MAKQSKLIVSIGGQLAASFKKTIKQTQRSVSGLSRNLSRSMNDAATGATKGFKNVLRTDAWQGAAVAAGGFALAMRKAVQTAAEFETGMLKVKAVSQANGAEFKKLSDLAEELGRTTKFTGTEAAAGMEFLAMAGYKTEQILKATAPLLNLASAASMELADVADITSNMVGSMNMKIEDTAQIADVLAQTSRNANVNVAMLGESFSALGPTGANAKISLHELSAQLGVLGDSGIQGAMAGTALRNVIVRLSAPPAAAAKALTRLGVATKDASGNLRPMTDILHDMNAAMKSANLGSAEQADVLSKIFGLRALASGQTLLQAEANGKLAEKIKLVNDAAGASKEMNDTVMQGFEGQMKLLQSAMDGLLKSIGTPLLGPLIAVAKVLAAIMSPIAKLLSACPILALAATAVVAGFIGFVTILPIFAAVQGAMLATGITAGGMWAAVTGPVGLAIAAVIAVIAVFQLCYNKIGWFRDGVDAIVKGISVAWNWLCNALKGPFDLAMKGFQLQFKILGAVWNFFCSGIKAGWEAAVGYLRPIWDSFAQMFQGWIQMIQGVWQVFCGIFTGDSELAVEGVKNIFGGLTTWFGGVVNLIKNIFGPIWDGIVAGAQAVGTGVVAAFQWIVGGIQAAWNGLPGFVAGLWNGMIEFAQTLPEKFANVGMAIIDTIREGFMSRFNALKDTVVASFAELRKLLPFSDAKEGPFKDLTASGRAIMTTLSDGVRDREGDLKKATQNAAEKSSEVFKTGEMSSLPIASDAISANNIQPFKSLPSGSDKLLPGEAAGLTGLGAQAVLSSVAPIINVTVGESNATADEIAAAVSTVVMELVSESESDQRAGLND